MNGLKLCERCKGLWVYFGSGNAPRFCPTCNQIMQNNNELNLLDMNLSKELIPQNNQKQPISP